MTSKEYKEIGGAKLPYRRDFANSYRVSTETVKLVRPFLTAKGYLGLAAMVVKKGPCQCFQRSYIDLLW